MFFDPMYFVIVGPALFLALLAQGLVWYAFRTYSKVPASSGLTGHEVAERLLRDVNVQTALIGPGKAGLVSQVLSQVRVEGIGGRLSDHYDPSTRVLRLSEPVYGSDSLAALGVAAHETGHAYQHAEHYGPLVLRSMMAPAVGFGSQIWPLFFFGWIFTRLPVLIDIGVLIFAAVLLFSIVTLPVEFNASARAMRMLTAGGYISATEAPKVRRVLNAAALTYVASAVGALMYLIYLLMIRGRR